MRKLKEYLFIERDNISLFAPVILGIGILTGVFLPFLTVRSLYVFCLIISFISFVLFVIRYKQLASILIIFGLGVYVAQTGGLLRTDLLTQKHFIAKEYDKLSIKATVKFIDETHPTMKRMRRITLCDTKFNNNDLSFIKTIKMTCPAKTTENIKPGDIVDVFGKLTPYKIAAIPSAFDQKQYNTLINLDATGIAYSIKKVGENNNFKDIFAYTRRILTHRITEKMGNIAGGIASALITGDKSSIPTEIRDSFINSGTAHILAISGLHMSIVAALLFGIFLKIWQYISNFFTYIRPKVYAALFTIPLTFIYLALSGFSPSATRAFIMTTIFLLGVIFNRNAISLRSVSFAAFIILLFDSASLFLVSFQLSFCAVVALISFYESFQEKFSTLRLKYEGIYGKFKFYIIASICSTVIATLATMPVSVATFNRLSLSGIMGNIIAIPFISFIVMPLGIIALCSSCFCDVFINVLKVCLNTLSASLGYISKIPGSIITIKSPDIFTLYVIVFGGILFCLLKSKIRLIGTCLICIGSVIWMIEDVPDIIAVPGSKSICFVQSGKFYATSLRKNRRQIDSIQKTLGFDGKIKKKDIDDLPFDNIEYMQGLFYFSKKNIFKQIAERKHPYCPAYYKAITIK